MAWQYKVVYVDFRGRVSVEGDETFIEKNERRSSFSRRVLNTLGADGWELTGVQPLWPAETAYMIFKKEGEGDRSVAAPPAQEEPATAAAGESGQAPASGDATQHLDEQGGPVTHL